jgi:hypothetical protein
MNAITTSRSTATRLLACLLLVLFVAQSAAQAGQGCIARAVVGTCCCVEEAAADVPSCCAQDDAEPREDLGPVARDAGGCPCETIALPLVASAAHKPVDATAEAGQRVAAQTIALAPASWCGGVRANALAPRPEWRPPDRERRLPWAFAGQRDNAGRLSRLRVSLR